jgi:predicted neuraminidase
MKKSVDGRGLNWTDEVEVFTKAGSFDRNRLITSLSGDWLFPMYFAKGSNEEQFSAIQMSSDHNTWKEVDIAHSNYLVQPSMIRPKADYKKLLAYFRDRRAENIYISTSTDEGEHWTTPTSTTLENNNSGIQANVLYHTSGNVVLVFNPTHKARNPLVIAMSEDGGETWPYQRVLQEDTTGKDVEFSYPTVLQSPDGVIHVSHTYNRETIKYQSFKEEWIKQNITN